MDGASWVKAQKKTIKSRSTPTEYVLNNGSTILNKAPQEVTPNGTVERPSPPQIPAGKVSFRGWSVDDPATHANDYYTRDKFWSFGDSNTPDTVTANTTLYAVFSDTYLVSYTDTDGVVKGTVDVAPGNPVPEPDDALVYLFNAAHSGKQLLYWYDVDLWDGTTGVPPEFVYVKTTASKDIALRPYYTEAVVVLFDSQGGSLVADAHNPQLVSATVQKPADPTKEGYTFKHWSTETNGSEFNFNTSVGDAADERRLRNRESHGNPDGRQGRAFRDAGDAGGRGRVREGGADGERAAQGHRERHGGVHDHGRGRRREGQVQGRAGRRGLRRMAEGLHADAGQPQPAGPRRLGG
jgi:hypothetical protein